MRQKSEVNTRRRDNAWLAENPALLPVNQLMDLNVSIGAAVLAGILSFLSPCVLPLVPPYLVYMSGVSLEDLTGEHTECRLTTRGRVMLSSLLLCWALPRCLCCWVPRLRRWASACGKTCRCSRKSLVWPSSSWGCISWGFSASTF